MNAFNKAIIAALVSANVLVLAGIARADESSIPAPSTPSSVVATFTAAPAVAHVAPIKKIQWNMVQVCDATLTHCVTRALGGKVDGIAKGSVR